MNKDVQTIFTNRLLSIMTEKGVSNLELAARTGIHEVNISQYRSGKKMPSTPNLYSLCLYFNVSMDWMTGLADDRGRFLTPAEWDLVELYKKSTSGDKAVIEAVLGKYRSEDK